MTEPSGSRPVRVAINAQLAPSGRSCGIGAVLFGLISALGRLTDGPEEYVIVTHWQTPEWGELKLGPNQRIVAGPQPSRPKVRTDRVEPLKRALGPLRPLARTAFRTLVPERPSSPPRFVVPVSDGFFEHLGCDVVHFPYQDFVQVELPTVYNPHDLQHLHYPGFFSPSTIAWRETIYRAGCSRSHTVAVASQWIKEDIVREYDIRPDKVQIIPWGPPTQAQAEPSPDTIAATQRRYNLHGPFAFYPAMTWEHKNHIRLIEAAALLREKRGLTIQVVCTGNPAHSHWSTIQECIARTGSAEHVRFLGVVPSDDLRPLYRLAQFVVIPTLFEASSCPVPEAWLEGVPVACAAVTSIPEQVRDAAFLFDPSSVEGIADAMQRLATDAALRSQLAERGRRRLRDFSWERTAMAYRAVYRRAAGSPLTDEDRALLDWDWMRDPDRCPPHDRGSMNAAGGW